VLLEVPAATIGNFDCLHYPDPETGVAYSAPSFPTDSRECPTIPQDLNGGWVAALSLPDVIRRGQETLNGTPLPNTAAAAGGSLASVLLFGGLALAVLAVPMISHRRRRGVRP
jgi:hypothetical protein